MLLTFSDKQVVIEFQKTDGPADFAYALAQVAMWFDESINVRIAKNVVTVRL